MSIRLDGRFHDIDIEAGVSSVNDRSGFFLMYKPNGNITIKGKRYGDLDPLLADERRIVVYEPDEPFDGGAGI